MSNAYGSNAKVIAAFESTYGSIPADGYTQIPFSKYDVSAIQGLIDDDLLGNGRDPSKPSLDAISVSGGITVPVDSRSFGFWLKAALGAPVTTGLTTKLHTFKSGAQNIPSICLQVQNPEIPLYRSHMGAKVDTLEIDFQRTGLTVAQLSLIAQGENKDAGSADSTLTTYDSGRFSSFNGFIKKDGVSMGRVVSAKLKYSNGLDKIETIRSDGKLDGVDPTNTMADGSITVRFDSTTLFDSASSGTPVKLEFGYDAGTDKKLNFIVHEAYLSRPSVPIDGPKGIQVTFDFKGAKNATEGCMLSVELTNDVEDYV